MIKTQEHTYISYIYIYTHIYIYTYINGKERANRYGGFMACPRVSGYPLAVPQTSSLPFAFACVHMYNREYITNMQNQLETRVLSASGRPCDTRDTFAA